MLDTHIAVWAVLQPARLNRTERSVLEDPDYTLVLSAVAVWELRLKWFSFHHDGHRKGPLSPSEIIDFARRMAWEILSLTAHHAAASLHHPLNHKDPFDELMLVQAQVEGMRLLTRDAKLTKHPLAWTSG